MLKKIEVNKQNIGRWLLIFILIATVTFLHYFTTTEHSHYHGIYRRLYYLPIILSGAWFGIRGGVFSSLVISVIYVPHILIQWEHNPSVRLEQVLEMLLYNVIGVLTGVLSSQVNYQRLRAESNMRNLSESYAQLKEQADMIVEIEDQLRRADRLTALGELSAGMAHEIRNPLGSIRGAAEILNDSLSENPRCGEFGKILIDEVDRLNQIVESYLNLARPMKNQQNTFKPDVVLDEAIQLISQQAVTDEVQIHWENNFLPPALGDSVQFKQVFLNLILNALQAMEDGGDLWIESSSTDNEVALVFRDSGPGIPDESLNKLFDPFFTTKSNGTGLGLAITYRIIQSYDGKISVKNSLNGGAEFTVILNQPG